MNRESGFYWVQISGKWMVCFFDNKHSLFFIPGKCGGLTSDYFEKIDERKIVRQP